MGATVGAVKGFSHVCKAGSFRFLLAAVSGCGYDVFGSAHTVGEDTRLPMITAAELIAETLHLFGIIDATEDPTPTDTANNVKVLNHLLRAEQADGAAQYLMKTESFTLPAGVFGQVYSFSIVQQTPATRCNATRSA